MFICLRGWRALHRVQCSKRQLAPQRLWLVRSSPCVVCVQTRNISEETYRTYFSPESPPIAFAQNLLETFQSVTGLPWWASLILTTVTLRTCVTLPLQVYSNHVLARVENLQPEIMDLSKTLKGEVAHAMKKFNWEKPYARKKYNATMKGLVRDLYIRDNCHPFKASVVMWVQLPMWISLSFALRNMSGFYPFSGRVAELQVLCTALSSGGLLWFPDLTVPDSTWILPVILGVSNLCIIEMQSWKKGKETAFQKGLTNFLRCISVVMIPIGASVPSCMCLYWVSSSLFGFVQNIVFKFPRVRRAVGIPQTPSESETPIRDMLEIARSKYTRTGNKEE